MSARSVPEGASAIIPRLVCRDPGVEIDFCVGTFDAVEGVRRPGPDGAVVHAMVLFGPAMVMIEAEWPGVPSRAPALDGTSPVILYVYVDDVDRRMERAVGAGATVLAPPADQFWGDRTASVMDPQGHVWTLASRVEDTTETERAERWTAIGSARNT